MLNSKLSTGEEVRAFLVGGARDEGETEVLVRERPLLDAADEREEDAALRRALLPLAELVRVGAGADLRTDAVGLGLLLALALRLGCCHSSSLSLSLSADCIWSSSSDLSLSLAASSGDPPSDSSSSSFSFSSSMRSDRAALTTGRGRGGALDRDTEVSAGENLDAGESSSSGLAKRT